MKRLSTESSSSESDEMFSNEYGQFLSSFANNELLDTVRPIRANTKLPVKLNGTLIYPKNASNSDIIWNDDQGKDNLGQPNDNLGQTNDTLGQPNDNLVGQRDKGKRFILPSFNNYNQLLEFIAINAQLIQSNPQSNIGKLKTLNAIANKYPSKHIILLAITTIFKDIIPNYKITQRDASNQSKDVKKLWEFESQLLSLYQSFLQILEQSGTYPFPYLSFTHLSTLLPVSVYMMRHRENDYPHSKLRHGETDSNLLFLLIKD
jgi:hypothetical protein